MNFIDKLASAQTRNQSCLCLSLDVVVADTPLPLQYFDEPMLPLAREIIAATSDLVCAYAVNLSYFLAEGAAGMVALERIVRLIPDGLPLVFDARAGDEGALPSLLRGAFGQFHGDAVTLRVDPGSVRASQIGAYSDRGFFLPMPHNVIINEPHYGFWLAETKSDSLRQARSLLPKNPLLLLDAASDRFPLQDMRDVFENHPGAKPMCVVGREIVYASKRMTFADDARAAAMSFRGRFSA